MMFSQLGHDMEGHAASSRQVAVCIFANGRNTNYIISHLSRVPALESSGSVFDNDINTISADKTFRTSI